VNTRRQRLHAARLYLVCDAQPDPFLHAVLAAGVDLVQLRMKDAPDEEVIQAGRRFRYTCSEHDVLLILNDRPDLVEQVGADGVHVGQDDVSCAAARELVGADRLVGLSTHDPIQIDSAVDADYIGVGPVFATPTKPGRPAVGLELVAYAARHATVPFFAIGGIAPENVAAVLRAGAQRVAVVRALTEASDPAAAARRLREALPDPRSQETHVGAT
jgi:thiamine-phosphate pyrophosphorylase